MRQHLKNFQKEVDPLQEILERHLYRASTEGQNVSDVIDVILFDYVKLLYSQGVHIPNSVKAFFMEDLKEEIQELIIKKTHASIEVKTSPPGVRVPGPTRRLS